jgi:hypothetical protein
VALVAQVVPLQPVPAQLLNVTLGDQQCQIAVTAKNISVPVLPPGSIDTDPPVLAPIQVVFLDLYVADVLVIGGCLARNGVGVVQNDYLGFVGEITIEDTQPDPIAGPSDPFVSGLGSRFLLSYWSNA